MIRLYFFCFTWWMFFACTNQNDTEKIAYRGKAFGTTYTVQFYPNSLNTTVKKKSLDSIIEVINLSMSTYQDNSLISKINKGDKVIVDTHFENVFKASKSLHRKTLGIFDPTIGILVNAWDFGPESKIVAIDSVQIDSLLRSVGLSKVELRDRVLYKENPNTFLDFNALAKGYAVDVVAEFLKQNNIVNFLVEIGGEIRSGGINLAKSQPWKIGVEDPNFDGSQSYSKVIPLKDQAMATSGSYRKFKIDEEGNRYAHIIDTKTGYPLRSNLLSVSVIAPTCMIADAYATTFMAMGLEASKTFLRKETSLQAFFIYSNNESLQTLGINGFPGLD